MQRRLKQWVSNILESRSARIVLSLALTCLLFIPTQFANVGYVTDDDWAMAVALSNRFAEGDGICLFINAVISQIGFFLNSTLPALNWLYVMEVVSAGIACAVIIYEIISYARCALGAAFLLGIAVLAVPYCTYRCNFTVVAFMCCCAGGLLLLSRLRIEGKRRGALIAGILFILWGFMWRRSVSLLCIGLFCVAAVAMLLGNRRLLPKRSIVQALPFMVALMLCLGAAAYDNVIWSTPELHEWSMFNTDRALIVDRPNQSYADVRDILDPLDVSRNDYWMITHWYTEDPEFVTNDLLTALRPTNVPAPLAPASLLSQIASYVTLFTHNRQLAVYVLALIVGGLACIKRSRWLYPLVILLLALAASYTLFVAGRLPIRMLYPIWLCAGAALTAHVFAPTAKQIAAQRVQRKHGLENMRSKLRKHTSADTTSPATRALKTRSANHAARKTTDPIRSYVRTASTPARQIVSGLISATLILGGATCLGNALRQYDARLISATYNQSAFLPIGAITTYRDLHPDQILAFDTVSYVSFEREYLIRALPAADVLQRTVNLGGWSSRSPYATARNKQLNITNPIKALAEKEDYVYIAANKTAAKHVLKYLRQHYYPNAKLSCSRLPGSQSLYVCTYTVKKSTP